jgi:serine/threonine protein phosphatase PrpC
MEAASPKSVEVKSKVIQLCRAQDAAYEGRAIDEQTGETYHYGIITDGHGSNETVRKIRSIIEENIDVILNSVTPHLEIQSRLDEIHKGQMEYAESLHESIFYKNTKSHMLNSAYSGGSTFLLSKLYSNRIEVFSIGDSEAYIMINNQVVYHNPLHIWSNESEKARLQSRTDIKVRPIYQSIPHIISPTRTGFEKSACLEYTDESQDISMKLAPTQSLGHNGITQFAPEKMTIPLEPTDAVKIVLASDGLWDVFVPDHPDDSRRLMEMDGEELADLAESRWKQEWEVAVDYANPDVLYEKTSCYPENSYDDVAVITMIRNPCVNV